MSRINPLYPVTSKQTDLRTIVAALDPSYRDKPWVYQFGWREFVDPTEPSALSLTGTPAAATVGSPYSFQPIATGGLGAKTYGVFSGDPSPLSMNEITGLVSGTPTKAGPIVLTLFVRDDNGNYALLDVSIVVN